MDKPFSQACENNKQPILDIVQQVFESVDFVLEIGSGTGQHAVYFAEQMPWLRWQPSDQDEYLPGIQRWRKDAALKNVLEPLQLNVSAPWPIETTPAIFSANTLHIMHWHEVEAFFAGAGRHLGNDGECCIYGPFNYAGRYTSDSNARFDQWLKMRDPGSGIRDFEAICKLAEQQGMHLQQDHPMPANNRLLHFRKVSKPK